MGLNRGDTKKRFLGILVIFLFSLAFASALEPFGASFNEESSQKAPADSPSSHDAIAGNVTEISVTGYSTTRSWQGYYGNVSGTIQLANNNDDVLYNWTLASPKGEIYASRSDSVSWTKIQCFNLTATSDDHESCNASAGGTCLTGMNLVDLEGHYNIISDDVDGVDETFSLAGTHESGAGYNHSLFYTNNLEFSAGECPSTHLFGENGDVNDSNFEEVLLYDPTATGIHTHGAPVFASILDEESTTGFDGSDYDFQMLVLEDGHGTNTATTTYYFYVELE